MSETTKDKILDILFDEYKRSADYTHEIENQIEKILSVWIGVMVLTFGIGLKENIHLIFFLMPVIVFSVLFYTVGLYENIVVAGGYTADLELRINNLTGKPLLNWESQLAPQIVHVRVPLVVGLFLWIGSSLSIVFYSVYRSFAYYPSLVCWAQIIFVSIASPVVIWHFLRLPRLLKKVKRLAAKTHEG